MANITASMVKDLRDKTGAGMMDCKTALGETNGDMEAAIDWLRKKGISKAAKKAGRVAAEGLVGVAVGGDAGALVEVNAETDFVARNDEFKAFVKSAAEIALEGRRRSARSCWPAACGGATVQETLTETGRQDRREHERAPRDRALLSIPGVVAAYVHNAVVARTGQDRRAGGAQIRPPTRRSLPRSASSSPCMSRPPLRWR